MRRVACASCRWRCSSGAAIWTKARPASSRSRSRPRAPRSSRSARPSSSPPSRSTPTAKCRGAGHLADADATVMVDETTGLVTGVSAGPGRVQATGGSLSSELISFNVLAPADTLIIVGDSVVTVAGRAGHHRPARGPPGELHARPACSPSRPVVYEITASHRRAARGHPPRRRARRHASRPEPTARPRCTVSRSPATGGARDRDRRGPRHPDLAARSVPGSGQRFIVLFQ